MKFIVASKEDTASMNIRRFVVEDGDWRAFGRFEGEPVLRSGQDALLVTIEDTHLYYDDIDRKVSEALGLPMPELVIFLSRHKSGSGLRTLTVHPLGCYHKADYGGRDGTLVPAAPVHMTKALRSINERTISEGLDFQVSYECTHHGPYLESPTFFIEIGSSEDAWVEEAPAKILASVILDVMHGDDDVDGPIAIGIGGGHYAPRFSEMALRKRINFGHMVPGYALKDIDEEVISKTVGSTPGASLVYFHRKAIKGPELRRLKDIFGSLGLTAVREKDLEQL